MSRSEGDVPDSIKLGVLASVPCTLSHNAD